MGRRHVDVLAGKNRGAAPGHALWPVYPYFTPKGRGGRALGGALRGDGGFHFAPVTSGPTFDWHSRGHCADELQAVLDLYSGRFGGLVRGSVLRGNQDGAGRKTDERRAAPHLTLVGRCDAGAGSPVLPFRLSAHERGKAAVKNQSKITNDWPRSTCSPRLRLTDRRLSAMSTSCKGVS